MENETMREAYGETQRLSDDSETRRAAIAREIHMKDQLQRELDAEAKGKLEGKAESLTDVVLNMYHRQHAAEEIAKVTNMLVEDVLRIVRSKK